MQHAAKEAITRYENGKRPNEKMPHRQRDHHMRQRRHHVHALPRRRAHAAAAAAATAFAAIGKRSRRLPRVVQQDVVRRVAIPRRRRNFHQRPGCNILGFRNWDQALGTAVGCGTVQSDTRGGG